MDGAVMTFLVVPDALWNAIDRALDAEIAKHPDAENDKPALRSWLINFYNEHGYVPEFSLARKEAYSCTQEPTP